MKSCSTCKQVKSLEEFAKDSRLKSGRTAQCLECRNRKRRETGALKREQYDPSLNKCCTTCQQVKQVTEFHRQDNGKLGVKSSCKACQLSQSRERWQFHKENNTEFYQKTLKHAKDASKKRNPENILNTRYKHNYGIDLDTYNKMRKDQQYLCKICGVHETEVGGRGRKLCVDHCHSTGQVRGLLCTQCNTGLGYFKDNTGNLEKAIKYLEIT